MIDEILGVKNATRSIPESEWEKVVPKLARELTKVDFKHNYPEDKLHKDWMALQRFSSKDFFINSQKRTGMKLCEHYFPNFFDIQSDNKSFSGLWKDPEVLEKVLRWNRQSHSTPYLSELRRGVYFTQALPKSTMYRPLMAKMIVDHYNAKVVLDPCAGWGGRMLGALASGAEYHAFEPNRETHYNLLRLAEYLNVMDRVNIICDDFLNVKSHNIPKVDLVLTSPPYWDLEVYDDDPKQSIQQFSSYKEWIKGFIIPAVDYSIDHLKQNGTSCWNVAKVRSRHDLCQEVENCHEYRRFYIDQTFSVVSSRRQFNQKKNKNLKSKDDTVCYKKR